MKLRIVQIEDGRFGVQQKYHMFSNWDWCDIKDNLVWWDSEKYADQYCLGSIEQAEEALERHVMKNKKPKIRVVKVIRTVRL